MPWFVLLLWLLLWLLPSGQIQAQPTTAYGDTGAVEALVSELIVNSKKGPVLSLRNVKINGRSNQLITHTGGAVSSSSTQCTGMCKTSQAPVKMEVDQSTDCHAPLPGQLLHSRSS